MQSFTIFSCAIYLDVIDLETIANVKFWNQNERNLEHKKSRFIPMDSKFSQFSDIQISRDTTCK